MNNNNHNGRAKAPLDPASSYPPTSASPMNNNSSLFTSAEKNQLHSFLDTFNPTDQSQPNALPTSYNTDEENGRYTTDIAAPSSPTPVLLSPPFSRNNTFGRQHIQTLPVHDGQQQSMYRKQSTDSSNKREIDDAEATHLDIKKYRLLIDDSTTAINTTMIPSSSHMDHSSYISSSFTSNNTDIDHRFVLENATSSSSSSSAATAAAAAASTSTSAVATRPKGSGRGRKPAHELLSNDQKKANHIASEQKRRANIRIGFDQLVGIVPNLSECQRSESLILHKSADYIRQLVDTKNSLRDRVRELQIALGEVPDEDSSEGEMDFGF